MVTKAKDGAVLPLVGTLVHTREVAYWRVTDPKNPAFKPFFVVEVREFVNGHISSYAEKGKANNLQDAIELAHKVQKEEQEKLLKEVNYGKNGTVPQVVKEVHEEQMSLGQPPVAKPRRMKANTRCNTSADVVYHRQEHDETISCTLHPACEPLEAPSPAPSPAQAPLPNEIMATCVNNVGMTDQFDIGENYLVEPTSDPDLLQAMNKRGEIVTVLAERFKTDQPLPPYQPTKIPYDPSGDVHFSAADMAERQQREKQVEEDDPTALSATETTEILNEALKKTGLAGLLSVDMPWDLKPGDPVTVNSSGLVGPAGSSFGPIKHPTVDDLEKKLETLMAAHNQLKSELKK